MHKYNAIETHSWKDDQNTVSTPNNLAAMSCVCYFTTPLLVSQPQSYLSVKKINVTARSSTEMVLRPLAVWTVLMTVVSWLRLSMSAIQREISWVQAVHCQPHISSSDMVSRSWFSQTLAAIMQLGIYVTSAQRLLKAPFSIIGQTLAELFLTMERWAPSEAFCQRGALKWAQEKPRRGRVSHHLNPLAFSASHPHAYDRRPFFFYLFVTIQ